MAIVPTRSLAPLGSPICKELACISTTPMDEKRAPCTEWRQYLQIYQASLLSFAQRCGERRAAFARPFHLELERGIVTGVVSTTHIASQLRRQSPKRALGCFQQRCQRCSLIAISRYG